MPKELYFFLSRREAQIMDIIYRLGKASVSEVLQHLPDPPAYNSIRVLLGILEKKGYLRHQKDGQRYIYEPTELPERAKESALKHMVKTLFQGSASSVVATLLDLPLRWSQGDLEELSEIIEKAKTERKPE